ncbi:protein-disulfide reductase DsbD N-terminal domain-containing protein [Mucilaginibacter sp. BJC16-A38]|uniref:protein-disulfide reductase DsbD N-terminal domain-containing protein n=1 Tax=Mucilaginibacter phenanthrenivorans TaxID=1234842 RepID=UPI002157A31A|nr:protein-disulfide reductase DsbD N-terminal domain-containing protein [Mucilaginibacter phenanthrenivorans]MCR8559237.1 protein-disulfide reductase DsbD N-terminal domain-containing protein [Mucilaginibacter phenanthrenivorans]
MKRIILAFFVLLSVSSTLHAQVLRPVRWSYAAKRLSKTEAVVFIKATIDEDWHLYSQTVPDRGPTRTSFAFSPSKNYALIGTTLEPKPLTRFEKVFGIEVAYFENSVIFQQKIKLNVNGPVTVNGSLEYMTCNDEKCLPPETVSFSIMIK